jgi:hypothetical protein
MPKTCAAIRVWNAERFIQPCIESIYSVVDEILVAACFKPWNGGNRIPDRTEEIIDHIPDPGKKIYMVCKDWKTEDETNDYIFDWCKVHGWDWMALIDADEFYKPDDFRRIKQYAYDSTASSISVLHKVYWKSPRYRLDPDYLYANVLFRCRPDLKMVRKRHISDGRTHRLCYNPPNELACCYHLSYAKTDGEMKEKLSTFSHADEIPKNWYENVWKKWDVDHNLENLHPIEGPLWKRTVEEDPSNLPEAVKRFL